MLYRVGKASSHVETSNESGIFTGLLSMSCFWGLFR